MGYDHHFFPHGPWVVGPGVNTWDSAARFIAQVVASVASSGRRKNMPEHLRDWTLERGNICKTYGKMGVINDATMYVESC